MVAPIRIKLDINDYYHSNLYIHEYQKHRFYSDEYDMSFGPTLENFSKKDIANYIKEIIYDLKFQNFMERRFLRRV